MAAQPVASAKSSTIVKVKPGTVVDGGAGEQTALLTAARPLPRLASGTGYRMSVGADGAVVVEIPGIGTFTLEHFEHLAQIDRSKRVEWNLAAASGPEGAHILHGDGPQISVGGLGADTIDAQAGDVVFGAYGDDLVRLSGKAADYDMRFTADGGLILHRQGEDDIMLREVERLRFSDREVAVEQSSAGAIYGDFDGSGMVIMGQDGPNTIFAGGHDTIDGGAGVDTVVLGGRRGDYTFSLSASGAVVATGADGSAVTMRGVERLLFADGAEQLVAGTSGADHLRAGPNALVLAGAGDDRITVSGDGSVVWGGEGTDYVRLLQGTQRYSFWRSNIPGTAVYAVNIESGETVALHDVEWVFDDTKGQYVRLESLVKSRELQTSEPTGNVFADVLLLETTDARLDGGRVVHYYLNKGSTSVFTDSQGSSWTGEQAAAFRKACNAWSAVTNVTFERVMNASEADLVVSMVGTLGIEGALGVTAIADPSLIGPEQIAFVNSLDYTVDANGDSYGFETMLHELGHALGLDHPFQLHDMGLGAFESQRGTLMSYTPGATLFDGHLTLQRGFVFPSSSKQFPSPPQLTSVTPMAFDIAAMQAIYGRKDVNTGDNSYLLSDKLNTLSCILDTGGIDTLGYSGKLNAVLDLRAATLDPSDPNAAGALSYLIDPKTGQSLGSAFTIAHDVVIENASGGSGDDTLTGNEAANILSGNDGNDLLIGGDGADLLSGGNGADTLIGGPGADTLTGGSGADLFVLNDDRDCVTDASRFDTVIIRGKGNLWQIVKWQTAQFKVVTMDADQITGWANAAPLFGLAGADTLNGLPGDDTVDYSLDAAFGGTSGVVVDLAMGSARDGFGDQDKLIGIDNAIGTAGADTFTGSASRNRLVGGDGNDLFQGLGDGDRVDGGDGVDIAVLEGRQSDWIISDEQVLAAGSGHHVVTATNLLTGAVVMLTDVERLQFGDGSTRAGYVGWTNLQGTNGCDTLVGWNTDDSIVTGYGNDLVLGGEGNDLINFGGGEGDYWASCTVDGGAGDDTILGLSNVGSLLFKGSSGSDVVATAFELVADYSAMTCNLDVVIDGDREKPGEHKAEWAHVTKPNHQVDTLIWNYGGESDGERGDLVLKLGTGSDLVIISEDKTQIVAIETKGNDTVVSDASDMEEFYIRVRQGDVVLDVAASRFERIDFLEDHSNGTINFKTYRPSDRTAKADVALRLGRAGWHRITSDVGAAAIELDYNLLGQSGLLIDLASRRVSSLTGSISIDDSWDANTVLTDVAGSTKADSIVGSASADVILANMDIDGEHQGKDTVSAGDGDDTVYVRGANSVDGGSGIDLLSADEPASGRYDDLDYSVTIDVTKHTMTFHGDVEGEPVEFSNFEAYSGNKRGNDVYIGSDDDETFITAGGNDTMTGGRGRDTFRFTEFFSGDRALITDFQAGQDVIDLAQAIAGSPKLTWGFMADHKGLVIDVNGDGTWDFSIFSANAIGVNDVRVK